VFGDFLDITGAFDNVKWAPVLGKLESLGASLRAGRMVKSYLNIRHANLTVEGTAYSRKVSRGCPQGSQLGPTLWKLAITDLGIDIHEDKQLIISYVDDIALLVGVAKPPTAFIRTERQLDKLTNWAEKYSLHLSAQKTQLMSIKGGLKANYTIRFGTSENAARDLGVTLDPRKSFWDHIDSLANKSSNLYRRLRRMTSANWGMYGQNNIR